MGFMTPYNLKKLNKNNEVATLCISNSGLSALNENDSNNQSSVLNLKVAG